MGNFMTGIFVSAIIILSLDVIDQNVPNSLGYWISLYTPFN